MPLGQTPISGLPVGGTLTGPEIFPADQGGVTSQFTAAQMSALVQSGFGAVDSGVANAYILTTAKPLPALVQGMMICFAPLNINNGASTVNLNGRGAVAILDSTGAALTGGEIGGYTILVYTGTVWELTWALPAINKRTAAEIAAAVVPTNYAYAAGNVFRYGAKGDGTTDDSTAVANALAQAGVAGGAAVLIPAGFKFKITSYLQILSNVTINLLGTLQLTNRQSGLFVNGATDVSIYGFGVGQITDSTVAAQTLATITGITQAAQAQVTVSSGGASNPFSVGQQVGISGVFGMTQINGLSYVVQSIGGISGAWTVTLNVNSTAFTAYASGGILNNGYFWNPGSGNNAPAIHLRSVTRAIVDGVVITNTAQGILVSNATANFLSGGTWTLTQASPTNVRISNCRITFTEWSGISSYVAVDLTYDGNYVYRNGDGGLWAMGGKNIQISNNVRLSPYATPSAVATFGANNMAQITTWNDEQGIELESTQGAIVSGNTVRGFWAQGIDIKNECNQILVVNNRVLDCENASIDVRQGETPNPCSKVDIVGNTISNHGTSQFNVNTSILGAIITEQAYLVNISDNIIYGYGNPTGGQPMPGIVCYGPAPFLAAQFPANPHEASVVIKGNRIEFKAYLGGENVNDFGYTANTQNAIAVNGQYDSVNISGNTVTADYFSSSDARINSIAAILLDYISANSTYYPVNAKIDQNMISGWGGAGISVTGQIAMTQSGLSVSGNNIGVVGNIPISLSLTNYCNVNGNLISQQNGANNPGIFIAGNAGNVVQSPSISGNMIGGGWATGGNGMQYAISLSFVNNANMTNNTMSNATAGAGVAALNFSNCTGNFVLEGTTGWPRSGAANPGGTVSSYWQGEQYLNTATPAFWWATGSFGSTTWVNS